MNISTKLEGLKSILQFDNKWQLIINRLFFKSNLNIYIYKGMKILIDHDGGDACGIRLCLSTNIYKKYLPYMSLMGEITVLDLGANTGGFPLMLRAAGISMKKLVCIEMNPLTWQRLIFNIKSNIDCENHCLNFAVAGENKVLEVFIGKGSTSDSIFIEADGKKAKCRISCQTIDTVFQNAFQNETVDICKMDIEAAEYEVLLNPGHDSLRNCRYLIMEIHRRDAKSESLLKKELQDLGFIEIISSKECDQLVYLFKNKNIT